MMWTVAMLAAIAVVAAAMGARRRRKRRPLMILPPARAWPKSDPLHRQAVHHFASGAMPPWN